MKVDKEEGRLDPRKRIKIPHAGDKASLDKYVLFKFPLKSHRQYSIKTRTFKSGQRKNVFT